MQRLVQAKAALHCLDALGSSATVECGVCEVITVTQGQKRCTASVLPGSRCNRLNYSLFLLCMPDFPQNLHKKKISYLSARPNLACNNCKLMLQSNQAALAACIQSHGVF